MIMRMIDAQVNRKLTVKKGKRKKLKNLFEKFQKRACYKVVYRAKARLKRYDGISRLGHDEFGRDIAYGVSRYIELLLSRGLKISTVVVLGSRAKGFWKPSSDVDVTIIGRNLAQQKDGFVGRRFMGFYSSRQLSDKPLCLGIEPSGCCSEEVFLRRIRRFDIQALDALYYGIVFYDDGFWRKAKEELQEMEKKYGFDEKELKEKLLHV